MDINTANFAKKLSFDNIVQSYLKAKQHLHTVMQVMSLSQQSYSYVWGEESLPPKKTPIIT